MIIPMKRVTLVAHQHDEANILKALQATQSVQIVEANAEAPDETALAKAEEQVQKLSGALVTLRPFGPKRGLLTAQPEESVGTIAAKLPEALALSEKLESTARDLASVKSEMEQNETAVASLRPWEHFPADMRTYQSAKSVRYFTGLLAAADVEKLSAIDEYAEYQFFSEGVVRTCLIACPNEEAKSVTNFLKSLDWTDYSFPKMRGTPAQAIASLSAKNRTLADRKKELETALAEQASGSGRLVEDAYDAAVIERDRRYAATELALTSATFQLEGWVPEDKLEPVEQAVRSVTDAYCFSSRDPAEDEVPPSYVENSKFATPFEQVTNMYSRPDPHGIDATPYMAPFYVLLFGMMLSDTGYGIVLALACALLIRLKKPTGAMGGFARVLFWGGISTMVWGVLVGTFFGMDFDTVFGTNNVFPLIVDPMSEPIDMLILCFGLGVLHVLFGVALKMKLSFSRRDWQTAIFDNFSWILIVLGLIAYGASSAAASAPALLGKIGLAAAGCGALMILLFKGRAKKNPVLRTISGLGELYQVTSYLSDILSYARLFALGIATGVIASVFNDLCKMLMGSPILILKILGILVACVLLVALHAFNIAINTLGAFVHCARLQYVEFYGKFYETGGKAFRPLGYRTKHVRITDDSAS